MVLSMSSAAFLYVFGILNSWSRLPFFGLNKLESFLQQNELPGINLESSVELNLSVHRYAPFQEDFANSPEEYLRQQSSFELSVCESLKITLSLAERSNLKFEWTFKTVLNKTFDSRNGSNCSIEWSPPAQGTYQVQVLIRRFPLPDVLFHASTDIKAVDFWIVGLGDSFASGEGNPDVQRSGKVTCAEWLDPKCHRSRRSWVHKVTQRLQQYARGTPMHFTYLACSGAFINAGVLQSAESTTTPGQLEVVEAIAKLRGRGPDLVMMAVGGNDVGYSDILGRLMVGNPRSLFSTVDMRIFYLAHELEKLGERMRQLHATQVVVPHYFDISRNEAGVVDPNCPDLRQISAGDLRLADKQILRRVNRMISDKGRLFRWTVVEGVPRVFRHGGICSKQSLIRNTNESLKMQGDSLGAFHPTESAHAMIADLVWQQLDFRLLLRS